jgi:hypothetical protein
MSLDASAPHLMISGASATGVQCRQSMFSQLTHHQHEACRSCASVGGVGRERIR